MKSRIWKHLLICCLYTQILFNSSSYGQGLFPSEFIDQINRLENPDDVQRLIDAFQKAGLFPITHKDSCLFVYLGEASKVQWAGDFNAWGSDTSFLNNGVQILENIWILKASFPKDARLDYKVIVDGNWILDPLNPNQQWSGMGGANSELRMPQWREEQYCLPRESKEKGTVSHYSINSEYLDREIAFSIYSPNEYSIQRTYPILYFTDGHEYSDTRLGNVITILDNLIQDKKIPASVAVFVDPRETTNLQINHRMEDYALNEKFLEFFLSELIPNVEDSLGFGIQQNTRAIIGTSLGGLNAAYFGIKAPETFPLLGIQSPAFNFKKEIFDKYLESENPPAYRIYMSTGVIYDTEDGARRMLDILNEKNYMTFYQEVNEGHSWGNWTSLMDDMLIFLLAGLPIE
jgi:enterochelin esterase family protein